MKDIITEADFFKAVQIIEKYKLQLEDKIQKIQKLEANINDVKLKDIEVPKELRLIFKKYEINLISDFKKFDLIDLKRFFNHRKNKLEILKQFSEKHKIIFKDDFK